MPNNEFGDFQTPVELAEDAMRLLGGARFRRILDPTCGLGNFLQAARSHGPAERVGIEIQAAHVARAEKYGTIIQDDVFSMDLASDIPWRNTGPLLVVGNPPWVTSADLTRFGSVNVPVKSNIRGLQGIAARTGESNFDVSEYIWLKLIRELADAEPTIALLCKSQVARNVLSFAAANDLPIAGARFYSIDSLRWFQASVDAGFLVVYVRHGSSDYSCRVFPDFSSVSPTRTFGVVDGRLVADVRGYRETKSADGESPLTWRQGLKHDATQVMELVESDGPHTKRGEPVAVESDYLFPLLKSTDVFRGRTTNVSKWMVVPQRHLADDTDHLRKSAPALWQYLLRNSAILDGRKSSIYRSRPRFCVFGVGEYTFAPYKVAVSGMHKKAEFRLIGTLAGKPAVFDDTCYFLSFADPAEAAVVSAVLSSDPAERLINSLVFWDAKRPITKKLLQRLDITRLAALLPEAELRDISLRTASEAGVDVAVAEVDAAIGTVLRRSDRSTGQEERELGGVLF